MVTHKDYAVWAPVACLPSSPTMLPFVSDAPATLEPQWPLCYFLNILTAFAFSIPLSGMLSPRYLHGLLLFLLQELTSVDLGLLCPCIYIYALFFL